MADTVETPRRGRREGPIDPALPEHRRLFARRLRDLRRECGQPTYRALGLAAHCGSGSLSEAASGRRLPTWETTRGYVTGCLRHAGREPEIVRAVATWRILWEEADRQESDLRRRPAAPPPPAAFVPRPAPTATPVRRRSVRVLAATVVALLVAALLQSAAVPGPPAMTGLFNVVAVPFTSPGGEPAGGLAGRFQRSLTRKLTTWSDETTEVRLRLADRSDRVVARAVADRTAALDTIARAEGADVVLTGRFLANGDRLTVAVEFYVSDRTLDDTPEFVGRHEITLTERADEQSADATLTYLAAIMGLVRGLGAYALDDYAAAEAALDEADQRWTDLDRRAGVRTGRREVLDLLLGNTIGRADIARVDESAEHYRRALAANPSYARAQIGLAEATRAGAGCTPYESSGERLHRALDLYRAALTGGGPVLLEMKARLGLGLTYQCLTVAGVEPRRTEADQEFTRVLRLAGPPALPEASARQATRQASEGQATLTASSARQAMRLAAEAHAGRALGALTADEHAVAAREYEEALRLLGGMDVVRPTNVERELVFLGNLRIAYEGLGRAAEARETERRITATTDRLAALR